MTDVRTELRAHRRQEPFVPFVIVLKDGRRFSIKHRFQYGCTDNRVGLYVHEDRDLLDFFSPDDISAIDSPQPVG